MTAARVALGRSPRWLSCLSEPSGEETLDAVLLLEHGSPRAVQVQLERQWPGDQQHVLAWCTVDGCVSVSWKLGNVLTSARACAGHLLRRHPQALQLPQHRLRALRLVVSQLQTLLCAVCAHPGFHGVPLCEQELQQAEGRQDVLCPAPAGGGIRLVLSSALPPRRAEIRVVVWDGGMPHLSLDLLQAGAPTTTIGSLEEAWMAMGMGSLQDNPPSEQLPAPLPPQQPLEMTPGDAATEVTSVFASLQHSFGMGAAAAEEARRLCEQLNALAGDGSSRPALARAGFFDFALRCIAESRGWTPSQEAAAPAAYAPCPTPAVGPPRVPLLRLSLSRPSESAPSQPPLHPVLPALLALLLRLLLSPDGSQLQAQACGGVAWVCLAAAQAALRCPRLAPVLAPLVAAELTGGAAALLQLMSPTLSEAGMPQAGALLGRGAISRVHAASKGGALKLTEAPPAAAWGVRALQPVLARAADAARAAVCAAAESDCMPLLSVVAEVAALRRMEGSGAAPHFLGLGASAESYVLHLPRYRASLAAWRRAHGASRAGEAGPLRLHCALFGAALRCVAAAAERGLVHGDVKADNLLLSEHEGGGDFWAPTSFDGTLPFQLVLSDWASSRPAEEAEEGSPPSPRRAGSECVQPPEALTADRRQGGGRVRLTHVADVWAAGLLLAEVLLGRSPLAAEAERDWPRFFLRLSADGGAVLPQEAQQALREAHPALAAFAEKLLQRAAAERPSAAEAAEEWRLVEERLELPPYAPPVLLLKES